METLSQGQEKTTLGDLGVLGDLKAKMKESEAAPARKKAAEKKAAAKAEEAPAGKEEKDSGESKEEESK